MASDTIWIGLDLGLQRTHVCVTDDQGETVQEASCKSSVEAIEALLAPYSVAQIGLIAVEAGSGMYISRKLRDRGFPVGIFEARKASKFLAIRKSKTDSGDAKGLADIARLGRNTVSQVFLKSPRIQELRSKLAMRHGLVRLRVSTEAMVRARLTLHGRTLVIPRSPFSLQQQCEAQLEQLRAEEGVDLTLELAPLIEVCEGIRRHLKRLDHELEAEAKRNPTCQLLMEVPGVGFLSALSFYTAIEDPTRFRRASDVAAYLGLVPKRYQSGEVSRVRGITKNGSKMTRTHLVTAATVMRAVAPDCALASWAGKLRERIGPKRSRVALARKLSIVLLSMWKTGSYYEPHPVPGTRASSR
jgi:transposase